MEGGKRFEGEHHPETETVVENRELGVSYKETIIELPEHRREETGVVRIKRRELDTFPEGFFGRTKAGRWMTEGWKDTIEYLPIWEFISDGKYPSAGKLGHYIDIAGDRELSTMYPKPNFKNPEDRRRIRADSEYYPRSFLRHQDEGLYFQSVFPEGDLHDKRFFAKDTDGKFQKTQDSNSPFGLTRVYTWEGWQLFRSPIRHPVYFFGTENKVFREYCRAISSNQEIVNLLKQNEYTDEPIDVALPGSEEFEQVFQKGVEHVRSWTTSTEEGKKAEIEHMELKRQEMIRNEVGFSKSQRSIGANLERFRLIAEGIQVSGGPSLMGSETKIPAVQHPDLRPLRWLHADLAIVPTSRSLNILFFEGA